MKLTQSHQQAIISSIDGIDMDLAERHYNMLQKDERVKDLHKRFIWDCFWYTKLHPSIMNDIYTYATDTHIETVLKKACKRFTFVKGETK